MPTLEVREMGEGDLAQVLRIEESSQVNPWAPNVFKEELERSWSRLMVVVEPGGLVLAFCNYWLVHDEVHLLNIATDPRRRRQGCARLLMHELLTHARQTGCRSVVLEVRRSNRGAITLYESLGFQAIGLRSGYYTDNSEDAVVMLSQI